MEFKGIEICCPACHGELDWLDQSRAELRCGGCHLQYPVVIGIPDLRLFPDPYIAADDDRSKGLKVAERFADLDFEGLIDFYYSMTSVVPAQHAQRYKRGLMAGVARAENSLTAWEQTLPSYRTGSDQSSNGEGTLLEIGCGTGPLLVAASSKYGRVVGVDIAFRWLAVGQKRLAEAGLDLPLICACAEALPFPDASFDRVVADSVIEHTQSQMDSMTEARRVMVDSGKLFLSTPNRLSIGPDPHTGVPAGGILPEKLTAAYVRRLGGIPPKRRLLSKMTLGRLLGNCGFAPASIFLPDVSPEQRALFPATTRRMIDLYHLLKRAPIIRHVLFLIGPLLYAVAEPSPPYDTHRN
ncbi:MAG: methyltransferase domain-containing protein [Chloroflexi bacterium]|nr:methyltransferase domain-containing protein [Chloroflexota bacterium]